MLPADRFMRPERLGDTDVMPTGNAGQRRNSARRQWVNVLSCRVPIPLRKYTLVRGATRALDNFCLDCPVGWGCEAPAAAMKPTFEPAWEFLRSASACRTLDALDDKFAAALRPFEFDTFSCAQARAPIGQEIDATLLFGRSHEEFDAYYLRSGYLEQDPCIPALFNNDAPYAWSDLQAVEQPEIAWQIWDEAAQAGARNGFVVGVPGDDNELYGVRLMSPERTFDP